ncbi:MAG: hypothetical protein KA188_09800, partial [Leadbetterella sp.]|nr:hypothetical protein [Leadbetterella sp.]
MKDFFKILIFSLFAITTYAQQATEIDSKFLKLPRYENLTAIDLAIPSPSQGMMVYNIDTKTNWYFNGTDWMNTHGAVSAPLNLTRTTSGQIGDCTICGERITNGDPMNPDVQGGIGVKGTASGGQTSNILAGSGVYGIGLGYNNGVLGYSDNSYGVYGNSSSGVGGYFSGNFALETSGVIKFGGSGVGTPATGKVLTSTDNSGFAAWQDLLPLFRTLDDPGNLLNLTNTGLGGSGYFRINNSLNNDNAVEGRILGGGSAFYGIAEGTEGYAARFESYNYFPTFKSTNYENGNAGRFEINNTNSIVEALNVNSNGLGRSGWFQSTNPLNNAATLIAENNGTGQGIYGTNFGTGKAGVFEINNSSNT